MNKINHSIRTVGFVVAMAGLTVFVQTAGALAVVGSLDLDAPGAFEDWVESANSERVAFGDCIKIYPLQLPGCLPLNCHCIQFPGCGC